MKQSRAYLYSLILHVALVIFLSMNYVSHSTHFDVASQAVEPEEVVKATTVDESQVEAQMKQLKQEARAREQAARRAETQATQAQKQREAEQKKLAALKKEQEKITKALADERKRQAEQLEKLKQEKREHEKALQAEKDKQAAEAQRLQDESEIARYISAIRSKVGRNWVIPGSLDQNCRAELKITLAPSGEVTSVGLKSSSCDSELSQSAVAAVKKASPLPVPKESRLFESFRVMNLTVRPEGFLS